MIGHSLGEYAAACVCGVCPGMMLCAWLLDAQGSMQQLPQGAMLAVRLPAKEVEPLLSAPLCFGRRECSFSHCCFGSS